MHPAHEGAAFSRPLAVWCRGKKKSGNNANYPQHRRTALVQVRPEKMAVLQKRVVARCNVLGKLVVVARIVDSMGAAPRPTRAEATDIANSVLDGADGFLLGAQTTRGACALEAVRAVLGICREAERCFDFEAHFERAMALLREVCG